VRDRSGERTAGIDFGLRIAAELAGDDAGGAIQLGLEYDPEPPFSCGHPDRAAAATVESVRGLLEPAVEAHRSRARKWRASHADEQKDLVRRRVRLEPIAVLKG
jgi:cyclohexyl-isocyanide hydratase